MKITPHEHSYKLYAYGIEPINSNQKIYRCNICGKARITYDD